MRCTFCKKEMPEYPHPICVNADGDFVCDEKCKEGYEEEKAMFFENIGNDKWYRENYPELNPPKE